MTNLGPSWSTFHLIMNCSPRHGHHSNRMPTQILHQKEPNISYFQREDGRRTRRTKLILPQWWWWWWPSSRWWSAGEGGIESENQKTSSSPFPRPRMLRCSKILWKGSLQVYGTLLSQSGNYYDTLKIKTSSSSTLHPLIQSANVFSLWTPSGTLNARRLAPNGNRKWRGGSTHSKQ